MLGRLRRVPRRPRFWLGGFTLVAAGAGFAVASLFWPGTDPESWALRLGGCLSAGLVAATCWWLLLANPGRYGLVRGALVGGVTGVAAHPLFWPIGFGLKAAFEATGWSIPAALVLGLVWGLTYGLFGLVLVGWATAGLGVLVGALFGRLADRFVDPAASVPDGRTPATSSRHWE